MSSYVRHVSDSREAETVLAGKHLTGGQMIVSAGSIPAGEVYPF